MHQTNATKPAATRHPMFRIAVLSLLGLLGLLFAAGSATATEVIGDTTCSTPILNQDLIAAVGAPNRSFAEYCTLVPNVCINDDNHAGSTAIFLRGDNQPTTGYVDSLLRRDDNGQPGELVVSRRQPYYQSFGGSGSVLTFDWRDVSLKPGDDFEWSCYSLDDNKAPGLFIGLSGKLPRRDTFFQVAGQDWRDIVTIAVLPPGVQSLSDVFLQQVPPGGYSMPTELSSGSPLFLAFADRDIFERDFRFAYGYLNLPNAVLVEGRNGAQGQGLFEYRLDSEGKVVNQGPLPSSGPVLAGIDQHFETVGEPGNASVGTTLADGFRVSLLLLDPRKNQWTTQTLDPAAEYSTTQIFRTSNGLFASANNIVVDRLYNWYLGNGTNAQKLGQIAAPVQGQVQPGIVDSFRGGADFSVAADPNRPEACYFFTTTERNHYIQCFDGPTGNSLGHSQTLMLEQNVTNGAFDSRFGLPSDSHYLHDGRWQMLAPHWNFGEMRLYSGSFNAGGPIQFDGYTVLGPAKKRDGTGTDSYGVSLSYSPSAGGEVHAVWPFDGKLQHTYDNFDPSFGLSTDIINLFDEMPGPNAGYGPVVAGPLSTFRDSLDPRQFRFGIGFRFNSLDFAVFESGITPCVADDDTLCLSGGRFEVETTWRAPNGGAGYGHMVPLSDDTGYFWFFNDQNVEMVVKVLDACSFADRFWVFAGGLTNVEVNMRVRDVLTGVVRSYDNPLNKAFQPVQDTSAFATCDVQDDSVNELERSREEAERKLEEMRARASAEIERFQRRPAGDLTGAARVETVRIEPNQNGVTEAAGNCQVNGKTLCLNDGRFRVTADWQDSQGGSGQGDAVALTGDTGYFTFFSKSNVELVVKVLTGCGINSRYWVFAGGLTNVKVTLTVVDTKDGETHVYQNPQMTKFVPIQDTKAFATCP